MKFSFSKTLRRVTRAASAGSATRAMQRAIGGAMARTVAATMSKLSAAPPARTKPAKAPRKAASKPARKRAATTGTPGSRSLGVVLSQLRIAKAMMPVAFRLSVPSATPAPSGPPALPKGARFEQRSYSGAAGSRDFKLFLPAVRSGGPKGLIVMLHGCTQDPDDFATGTNMNAMAQKHGLAVAYPAQTRGHNASACWNWFSPANQARGKGEPAVIAGLARRVMQEFGLERDRVFVAGLSAGGAMAVIVAETYPDVFSAAGVHSGLARGSATTLMSALSAMRSGAPAARTPATRRKGAAPAARRIVFHGDADSTVHPSNAAQVVAGAVGAREPARVIPKSAAGRDYVRSDYVLPDGTVDVEWWQIKGAGHAWSGGQPGGSYADPTGPDASAEMVRFFLAKAE